MMRPHPADDLHRTGHPRIVRFFRQLLLLLGFQLSILLVLWIGGFLWFYITIQNEKIDTDTPADAIVVLTGGTRRLETGLHMLADGKGRKLLISGVNRGVNIEEVLRSYNVPERLSCCIEPGYSANDTTGNAAETANWVNWEGFASLRLVTSNYHMPRSLLEFRAAMPNVKIIPHPVIPDSMREGNWPSVRLVAREYTKYLLARLRLWIAP